MIKIELTEDDALLFRAFREHQEVFSILYASGVFNVRSGKAVLNFNAEAKLESVNVDIPLFRKGHRQIQFLSTD